MLLHGPLNKNTQYPNNREVVLGYFFRNADKHLCNSAKYWIKKARIWEPAIDYYHDERRDAIVYILEMIDRPGTVPNQVFYEVYFNKGHCDSLVAGLMKRSFKRYLQLKISTIHDREKKLALTFDAKVFPLQWAGRVATKSSIEDQYPQVDLELFRILSHGSRVNVYSERVKELKNLVTSDRTESRRERLAAWRRQQKKLWYGLDPRLPFARKRIAKVVNPVNADLAAWGGPEESPKT